ncbi:hypothetical protein CS022_12200 [Veronia nyctiphanis]|uniref:Thioredoxin domain-containing protein n=1 Tax=Veronia nyctiphanis TaxID=1278244 RepID=A0A4Q0YVN4_9GAMM|nr:hypothetical protein [Veronia nyctiphanis]RXJ73041.1 hypothetical protein CS022_12200 [Veronia nyctiphanis]
MKGKKALLIVAAVFILPIAAAKLVLEMGLYQGGSTNNGHLFAEKDMLDAKWLEQQGMWRVVYPMPDDCGEACKYALFQLGQMPTAVGPNRDRFASIILTDAGQENVNQVTAQLSGQKEFLVQQIDAEIARQIEALPISHDGEVLYLADPLGNVIMAYPIPADDSERIAQGKGLLTDLRKLMKLSKVG